MQSEKLDGGSIHEPTRNWLPQANANSPFIHKHAQHDPPTPRAQKASQTHLCAGKGGGLYGSCRTLANFLRFHSLTYALYLHVRL